MIQRLAAQTGGIIQATNSVPVEPGFLDLEVGAQQLLRWQLLDRKADRVRRPIKSLVSGSLTAGFLTACGEQFGFRVVVESLLYGCDLIRFAHFDLLPAAC
jgi:hypothetical protein